MNFIHESNRVYLKGDDDQVLAEITFPSISDRLVCIDHTFVDSSLRGQGIAGKLMEETVGQLRNEGMQATATCSYAKKWFQEHLECSDIIKGEGL